MPKVKKGRNSLPQMLLWETSFETILPKSIDASIDLLEQAHSRVSNQSWFSPNRIRIDLISADQNLVKFTINTVSKVGSAWIIGTLEEHESTKTRCTVRVGIDPDAIFTIFLAATLIPMTILAFNRAFVAGIFMLFICIGLLFIIWFALKRLKDHLMYTLDKVLLS